MSIDKQALSYVAHLARIEFEPKELEKLSHQLKDILDFIDKLKKIDVDNIEPTSHILPINNVLRQDIRKDSLSEPKALMNAPERQDSFFIVPKVID